MRTHGVGRRHGLMATSPTVRLKDKRLAVRLRRLIEPMDRRDGIQYSDGVPGLGRDQGRVSLLQQPAGRRGRSSSPGTSRHRPAPVRRHRGHGPGAARHDRVQLHQREKPDEIGVLHSLKYVKDQYGGHATHTVCGVLLHSSLVLTLDGLPLGLAAVKFWTRKKFKGPTALRGKVNATRIPIEQKESVRWLENLHHL